jgi:hypothetical protein
MGFAHRVAPSERLPPHERGRDIVTRGFFILPNSLERKTIRLIDTKSFGARND